MIQSDDTLVLAKFKSSAPSYQRVLLFTKPIADAPKPVTNEPKPVTDDIKKYADAVNVVKKSVVQESKIYFSTGLTKVIDEMHVSNISVCVSGFSTETLSMRLDFYSDPYTELISFIAADIDGVITDNPKTASAFMRNPCVDPNSTTPFVFMPIKPGDYLAQVEPTVLPLASAPIPPLHVTDVIDPPLPPVNAGACKDSYKGGGGGSSEFGQRRVSVDAVATTLMLIGSLYVLLW
ncbi:glycerophosphodiester phosphodiesterase GDPDL7 [Tanacetum coccineum]